MSVSEVDALVARVANGDGWPEVVYDELGTPVDIKPAGWHAERLARLNRAMYAIGCRCRECTAAARGRRRDA